MCKTLAFSLFAEEGQDEFELDGFIVDDVEEEEKEDVDEERGMKRVKKRR